MTPSEVRSLQTRMVTLFLINLLFAVVAPLFLTVYGGLTDYFLAFVAGILIMTVVDRRYGRVIFWSVVFLSFLFWEVVLANIALAWIILQPKPDVQPAIVALPLRVNTGLEITMLATAITLTPATLSLELLFDDKDQPTLYIHALRVKDPDEMRESIRNGFERMILRIMRGNDR